MFKKGRFDDENEEITLQPNLNAWLDDKYGAKPYVGNADQIDQRSDDDERRDTKDI